MSNTNCPICFESLQNGSITTLANCRHRFHTGCIRVWINQQHSNGRTQPTCPLCRNAFRIENSITNRNTHTLIQNLYVQNNQRRQNSIMNILVRRLQNNPQNFRNAVTRVNDRRAINFLIRQLSLRNLRLPNQTQKRNRNNNTNYKNGYNDPMNVS